VGLGKGSACLSRAQILVYVDIGLRSANGNSESRAEKMLRVSESSGTLCTDGMNTQDLGQSDTTLFPHTFSVISAPRSRP